MRSLIQSYIHYRPLRLVSAISILLTFFLTNISKAQDSLVIHSILVRLNEQQVKKDPFFMTGIFPSYVSNRKLYREQRKDNNIYYNAIITYTLNTIKEKLLPADRLLVDSIAARTEKLAAHFKNRQGQVSYNFWRTDSANRLPYLWWAGVKKKNILPDDYDCTSMCLLSMNAPDTLAQRAHFRMQQYRPNEFDQTNTIFSRYREYAGYSTWLEKKLPIVFDACVLANVLSFVQTYDLKWTKTDSSSLDLLIAMVNNKDHLKHPLIMSPYYGNTSIILYHLSRLMSIRTIPKLESIKPRLINDALDQLKQSDNELEKLILSISLMKWDYYPPAAIETAAWSLEKNDFPFFIGNIPSIFPLGLKKPFSKNKIGFYYHYCPAYNDVLVLEYLILKKERKPDLAIDK